jgi:hypothetical protein
VPVIFTLSLELGTPEGDQLLAVPQSLVVPTHVRVVCPCAAAPSKRSIASKKEDVFIGRVVNWRLPKFLIFNS